MYVCICNAITDRQIRDAAESGIESLWELQAALGVASNCGACKESAAEILHQGRRSPQASEPQVYIPATSVA